MALVGSVSKTLSPALGIGWMVAPPRLDCRRRAAARTARPGRRCSTSSRSPRSLRSGGYDRQLRACRKSYRDRRDALAAALAARLPEARSRGAAAGLHLLVHLPAGHRRGRGGWPRARAAGVRVASLDTYRIEPGPPGLVLGYGNLAGHQVEEAVARLAAAVRSAASAQRLVLSPRAQSA